MDWDTVLAILLSVGFLIVGFLLRIFAGIFIAGLLTWLCGVLDIAVDEVILNTVVIGVATVSVLFPTAKKND